MTAKTEIRIRREHENGYDIDETQAVLCARGVPADDDDRGCRVVVTAVYTERVDTGRCDYRKQPIIHEAGQPVFGMNVEVYPRARRFGQTEGAQVNWGAIGSQSPEVAAQFAEMLATAARIAGIANRPSED